MIKTKLNQLSYKLKNLIKKIKIATISSYLKGILAEKDTECLILKAPKSIKQTKTQIIYIRKEMTWANSNNENLIFVYEITRGNLPTIPQAGG